MTILGADLEGAAGRQIGNLVPGGPVGIRVRWNEIEREKDEYDFSRIDADVQALKGHPLLLKVTGTPEYCRVGEAICSPPIKRKRERLSRFILGLIDRCARGGGDVEAVELWNEPDIPADAAKAKGLDHLLGGFGVENGGSYGGMLADVYRAVKYWKPGVKVIGGGLQLSMTGAAFWHKARKRARGCYDAVSFHSYSTSRLGFNLPEIKAGLLRDVGETRPLWLTETSYLYESSTPDNEQSQAEYLWSLMGRLREMGIDRVYWYTLGGNGWRHSDLVEGGRCKPAWSVYNQLG